MKKYLIPLILLVLLLTGCVSNSLYYWGNYSNTLYKIKKDPGAESLTKHMDTIEKIIEKSQSGKYQVPPGIYCEYGYYLILKGDIDGGLVYFDKEVTLYPESQTFVETMKAQTGKEDTND